MTILPDRGLLDLLTLMFSLANWVLLIYLGIIRFTGVTLSSALDWLEL